MAIQYTRENFDAKLVDLSCDGLAFDPTSAEHGQFYTDGKGASAAA